MIADYERQTFSMFPTNWTMPLTPEIRAIYSPSYNITSSTGNPKGNPGKRFPIGAKIGAIIGLVTLIILAALLLYFLVVRPRRRARAAQPELDATETEVKLPNEGVVVEVNPIEAEQDPVELGSGGTTRALDQGQGLDNRLNNLHAIRELDGRSLIELPA